VGRSKKETAILYKKVFGTDEGMKVLKELMKNCNFINGTYSDDQGKMYFYEGRRSVVCEILDYVNMNLDMLMDMYSETQEDWMEEN
jgi:hypothetical protein